MIKGKTDRVRYEIDEQTFALYVWDIAAPEGSAPFLYQPDRPDTTPFTDVEDTRSWLHEQYGPEVEEPPTEE